MSECTIIKRHPHSEKEAVWKRKMARVFRVVIDNLSDPQRITMMRGEYEEKEWTDRHFGPIYDYHILRRRIGETFPTFAEHGSYCDSDL